MMTGKNLIEDTKKTILGILVSCCIIMVPFYFDTSAMTKDNADSNSKQDEVIRVLKQETEMIKTDQAVSDAVTESELKHMKEILLRIESNQQELIREVKNLD